VSGSPLEPVTPEVFVNRAGGGRDGIIIDEHDNLWIACNQSDEVMVLEPKQGGVISATTSKGLRTVDGPWAAQVKPHAVSKRIPGFSG
jgi:hypothetical protein